MRQDSWRDGRKKIFAMSCPGEIVSATASCGHTQIQVPSVVFIWPSLSHGTRHTARRQWPRGCGLISPGHHRARFRFPWGPLSPRRHIFFRASSCAPLSSSRTARRHHRPQGTPCRQLSRSSERSMAAQALLSGRQLLGRPVQSAVSRSSSARKAPFVVRASSSPPAKVPSYY